MFVINEYTRLCGIGCGDIILLPNQPFEAFEGKYKVSAYARVLDKNGKDIIKLQAGDIISDIGEVKAKRTYKKKKVIKDGNRL
ncbi:MAG: hypothetical protein E3J43_06920 [Candidatus Heimdallarchaeota archaeon]|nr:MAG: hypothetical protein E3J43_06920 [Candidatus Heimdallarchaeota archaeon]